MFIVEAIVAMVPTRGGFKISTSPSGFRVMYLIMFSHRWRIMSAWSYGICIYIQTAMHTFTLLHIHMRMHGHISTHTQTHIHLHARILTHTPIDTGMHAYIHTYMRTYIYACTVAAILGPLARGPPSRHASRSQA